MWNSIFVHFVVVVFVHSAQSIKTVHSIIRRKMTHWYCTKCVYHSYFRWYDCFRKANNTACGNCYFVFFYFTFPSIKPTKDTQNAIFFNNEHKNWLHIKSSLTARIVFAFLGVVGCFCVFIIHFKSESEEKCRDVQEKNKWRDKTTTELEIERQRDQREWVWGEERKYEARWNNIVQSWNEILYHIATFSNNENSSTSSRWSLISFNFSKSHTHTHTHRAELSVYTAQLHIGYFVFGCLLYSNFLCFFSFTLCVASEETVN